MSQITSHVLDTTRGVPAVGLAINLYQLNSDAWQLLATDKTDQNGRNERSRP